MERILVQDEILVHCTGFSCNTRPPVVWRVPHIQCNFHFSYAHHATPLLPNHVLGLDLLDWTCKNRDCPCWNEEVTDAGRWFTMAIWTDPPSGILVIMHICVHYQIPSHVWVRKRVLSSVLSGEINITVPESSEMHSVAVNVTKCGMVSGLTVILDILILVLSFSAKTQEFWM